VHEWKKLRGRPREEAFKEHVITDLKPYDGSKSSDNEDFKATMRNLKTLKLLVQSNEMSRYEFRSVRKLPTNQRFMEQLEQTWLGNCQKSLRELDLGFRTHVGFYSKLDLRGLEIARLKVLKLTKITLTHQWQIDWICSHGPTLEILSLIETPIIVQATTRMVLDEESYPIEHQPLLQLPETVLTFHLKWSEIQDQIRERLPDLRAFEQEFMYSADYDDDDEWRVPVTIDCCPFRYITYDVGFIDESAPIVRQLHKEEYNADSSAYERL
jgi:hypothetical protein